jgi:hypothetical protein
MNPCGTVFQILPTNSCDVIARKGPNATKIVGIDQVCHVPA